MPAQCPASEPQGDQCTLPRGHKEAHRAFAAPAKPTAMWGSAEADANWRAAVEPLLAEEERLRLEKLRQYEEEAKKYLPTGPIAVFSYPGRTQADASQVFLTHARELAARGYSPVAQSWGEGRPGAVRYLLLGLDSIAIRPKGFLTVTYKRAEPAAEPAPATGPNPIEQIRQLGQLRDAGLITPEEFEAKKADLLARM